MNMHISKKFILMDSRDGKIVLSGDDFERLTKTAEKLTLKGSGATYSVFTNVCSIGHKKIPEINVFREI